MNETTKDLIRNILVFVFLILTIAVIYAYDVFKDSKKTGLSPFSHKVLVCEFSNKEPWSEYNEQDIVFKKNYPDFDFPKFIALQLKSNKTVKFVSMKWGEDWIIADKVFVNPYFDLSHRINKKLLKRDLSTVSKNIIRFSTFIPSELHLNDDGRTWKNINQTEYINFEIINDEILSIDYWRVSYTEYKCVKTDKPILE